MSDNTTNNNSTQEELNPFAIFDTKIEDVQSYEETTAERKDWSKIFYEPDPEQGKKYLGVIKFLPNIYSAKQPILKKFIYKLKNPDNAFNFYFDSPTTVGDWEGCPVFKEWQRLNNSESAIDKAKAKQYKRTRTRCAVIQVLKDIQHPELQGELRLFRFQFDGDIDKKIKAKIDPSKEEIEMGEKPVDIFNPFGSVTMKISVVLDSNGRDFSGCTLDGPESGMAIKNEDGTLRFLEAKDSTDKEVQKAVVEALKQDHVNIMEHYAYKQPDEARLQLAKRAIAKISGAEIEPESTAPATDLSKDAEKPAETKEEKAEKPAEQKSESNKSQDQLMDELFKDEQ